MHMLCKTNHASTLDPLSLFFWNHVQWVISWSPKFIFLKLCSMSHLSSVISTSVVWSLSLQVFTNFSCPKNTTPLGILDGHMLWRQMLLKCVVYWYAIWLLPGQWACKHVEGVRYDSCCLLSLGGRCVLCENLCVCFCQVQMFESCGGKVLLPQPAVHGWLHLPPTTFWFKWLKYYFFAQHF